MRRGDAMVAIQPHSGASHGSMSPRDSARCRRWNGALATLTAFACCLLVVQFSRAADVRLRLQTSDMQGNATTEVMVGETFWLDGYVQDVRDDGGAARGVFAAFLDVTYSADLVVPDATGVKYGDAYPNFPQLDPDTPGVLNEVGAIADVFPLGTDEQLLFRVPFDAAGTGQVTFASDPPDMLPIHEILVFGSDVPVEDVEFGSVQLTIVPEPQLSLLALLGCLGALSRRRRQLGG